MIDDFGVTYRYLLEDKELVVAGVQVGSVDPLFLDPKGRYYAKPEEGGAIPLDPITIPRPGITRMPKLAHSTWKR